MDVPEARHMAQEAALLICRQRCPQRLHMRPQAVHDPLPRLAAAPRGGGHGAERAGALPQVLPG